MLPLYKHQQRLLDENPRKRLLAWSMGAGKTRTAIEWAIKNNYQTLIICPKGLVTQWQEQIVKWGVHVLFVVISKETFKLHAPKKYDALIVDECFVAGTKVLTKEGYKSIEDIHTGELVRNAFGYGKVMKLHKNTSNKIVVLKTSNGIIRCTPNHPFLTERGWVTAGALSNNDVLLHHEYMQELWEGNSTPNSEATQGGGFSVADILRQELSYGTHMENTWGKNTSKYEKSLGTRLQMAFKSIKQDNDSHTDGASRNERLGIKEYENQKSNVGSRIQTKNERYSKTNGVETQSPRWQWKTNVSSPTNAFSCIRNRLVWRIYCYYRVCTASLQNRHSTSKITDSNRSRRSFSFFFRATKTRQKKDSQARRIGVESITIQECSDTLVYNLSIEGHPSYVVKDILVHNCDHFFSAHFKSALSKALRTYIKKHDPALLFLTGTPYRSSAWNIYTAAQLLGIKWDYRKFQDTFFYQIRMGMRLIFQPKVDKLSAAKLKKLIHSIADVVTLEECADIPPQVDEILLLGMTAQQLEAVKHNPEVVPIARFTADHRIEGAGFKLERISRILEENGKIIVICRYLEQMDAIQAVLGFQSLRIDGTVKNRHDVIKEFEGSKTAALIVQSSLCEGWEAPSCSTMVFASMGFSYRDYVQMKSRILRLNALHKNVYIHLIADKADQAIMKAMQQSRDFDVMKDYA